MLKQFLESKPLYYDKIDYTRMPRVYESIKHSLKIPKIIHIIGTNGKGTTGRFLATALHNNNLYVGHYTSPHILKFNERIWLNGAEVSDEILEEAHNKLQTLLHVEDSTALSYFEYTTLLAIVVYENCDYVIMEAGLGGENDATAVFDKRLTLVTPIAKDHEAFLGNTLKEIATTKLRAVQKIAILSEQEDEVYSVADSTCREYFKVDKLVNENDLKKIKLISKELKLVKYLEQNLALAISALNFLKISYEIADFKDARLFGRLSKIEKNITVDVGHNTLAASSIVSSLSGNKYIIIYNSYKDKDYKQILRILKPIILHVELIKVNDDRIESDKVMNEVLDNLDIKHTKFTEIKAEYMYLVFGSFSVVEAFLKEYNG